MLLFGEHGSSVNGNRTESGKGLIRAIAKGQGMSGNCDYTKEHDTLLVNSKLCDGGPYCLAHLALNSLCSCLCRLSAGIYRYAPPHLPKVFFLSDVYYSINKFQRN